MVLVLDLRLGECRLVVHAPVDGAQALVNEAILVKRKEGREHHRLVLRVHRGVRAVEAAENADSFELLALQIKKLLGVLAAFRPHVGRTHLQLFAAEFLIDLNLNWEAMTVPARHVGRIQA